MAILGNNHKGTTGNMGSLAGRKVVSKYNLASAAVLTELHGWFLGSSGENGKRFILVVYADSAGSPGTLVAYTSPLTKTPAGDVELAQTGMSVSLAAGDYWIGVVCESDLGSDLAWYFDDLGTGTYKGISNGATFNPPSNPFGTTGLSGTRDFSIWAVVGPLSATFVPQIVIS